MEEGLKVLPGLIIPLHELVISTSRSGGAGGQHVNKTDSRVTIHWNIKNSSVLTDNQKALIEQKLHNRMTLEGELIVHNDTTRSQMQNKIAAGKFLAELVRNTLYIAKKRVKTKISPGIKAGRVVMKKRKSLLKQTRKVNFSDE